MLIGEDVLSKQWGVSKEYLQKLRATELKEGTHYFKPTARTILYDEDAVEAWVRSKYENLHAKRHALRRFTG
ncbi:hypothetical protein [Hydrogenimonas urashimensis]|uniref:hypothetical protein n=1 Tax=Hydrogenimonas urashimensis TaxID=2740515 RepID=UPI001916B521|nr:hypothetical protein [Hydrogenimonas urashimensis]